MESSDDETGQESNKGLEDEEVKDSSPIREKATTVSQRIENLRKQKKSSKTRLTKARNCLRDLVVNETSQRKNVIRRQIKKVKSEFNIVEKIIERELCNKPCRYRARGVSRH